MALKKTAFAAAVAVLLAAAAILTVHFENAVAANPTPEPVVEVSETDDVVEAVGSTDSAAVHFSLDPGFYDSRQYLNLGADGAEKILYTRDGSDPRVSGKQYRNQISLRSGGDSVAIHNISACAVYPDGSMSEPVTRSFLIGSGIANRFDCIVFSVTIDPDDLYNYEDGIFIAGKMRDDYLASDPVREIQPTDPANWNQRGRAGEREAYVEVFEYDGSCVISQKCGLRIFGGWSRSNDQKNLKLYARSEYDPENNRFRYEFFPDELDSSGNKIVSYKKLALRACANDAGYLYARDDAISAMAQATGIESKHSRPAAVFLNGEYYGFAWCQEVFSTDLLDHKYCVREKNPEEEDCWDIIKGCEYMMIEDGDDPDWARKNEAWREMYDYAYKDLTDDAVYAELEKLIDVDNFLTYYALNSYIGNGDWPNNNYKVFRYTGSIPAEEGSVFDGRWRYMLYDTDFAFGLYNTDFLSNHMAQLFNDDFFGTFPEDWRDDVHDKGDMYYKRSDLLISLCKRDDVRERFIEILCGISGYYYNTERVAKYFDEYCALRQHELIAASEEGKAMVWGVNNELEKIKQWASKRDVAARMQMAKVFPDFYDREEYGTVSCPPTEGAKIMLGAAEIVEGDVGYSGWFFDGATVKLSCELEDGARFERWEIGDDISLDPSTEFTVHTGDDIDIRLVIKRGGGIKIYETAYKGSAGGDYVTLKNFSGETLSTSGMTLSDGSNEFILPVLNLAAGQSIKIIGKNYSKFDALGTVECGFNLREGETVTLYGDGGEVISEVLLRPAHRRTALRLDTYSVETPRYIEVSCNYKDRILPSEIPVPDWGRWGR